MTKKSRQEIVSVVEYFNGVGENVSAKSVKKYISGLLNSPIDLPIHYQLKLDELLRENDTQNLLVYLSNTLSSSVFLIDKGNYYFKGTKYLINHPEASVLFDFLESLEEVKSFIQESYGLHPLLIKTDVKGVEVGIVVKDFGNKMIGFLAPLNLDFELAIGLLNYLEF